MKQRLATLIGWLHAVAAFVVYRLTMAPTVSFWDCGEFIATSHKLMVGHPPGAPLYQLTAHLFTLLASSPDKVAFWSNMLSVVAASLTVAFLFWTLLRLMQELPSFEGYRPRHYIAASVGALSYCFCDTAWFSAVESEVYALAMLIAAVMVWASVRWYQCSTPTEGTRWLLLVALLAGMAPCVHMMALLALPFTAVLLLCRKIDDHRSGQRRRWLLPLLPPALLMFCIGLSPMVVTPMRADNKMPLNEGNPDNWASYRSYLQRDQYENAPLLYPRIWRHQPKDDEYYAYWSGHHGHRVAPDGTRLYEPNVLDNLQFFATYQLQYMYLRYFMWNFSGRYNDRNGLGSLQKGQFITGIPPVDRLLVGTGRWQPRESMPRERSSHTVLFLLPLLLGIWGMLCRKAPKGKASHANIAIVTLFLVSGVGLAVYLNMPCYQPRERDYAFVLSFYAWCLWIGIGALALMEWAEKRKVPQAVACCVVAVVPLLMAMQNYRCHDRSHNLVAYDTAWNMLHSCAPNAILLTSGDNDTFPLWYIQQVEGVRTDVQVVNTSLLSSSWYAEQTAYQLRQQGTDLLPADETGRRHKGSYALLDLVTNTRVLYDSIPLRPIYLTHYTANSMGEVFEGHLQLSGCTYRLGIRSEDTVAVEEMAEHVTTQFRYSPVKSFIDPISQQFVEQQMKDIALLADNMLDRGENPLPIVRRVLEPIDPDMVNDPRILCHYATLLGRCGESEQAETMTRYLQRRVASQLDYYRTLSAKQQRYIPSTLGPLMEAGETLGVVK